MSDSSIGNLSDDDVILIDLTGDEPIVPGNVHNLVDTVGPMLLIDLVSNSSQSDSDDESVES